MVCSRSHGGASLQLRQSTPPREKKRSVEEASQNLGTYAAPAAKGEGRGAILTGCVQPVNPIGTTTL